jgi:hypothetical protein
MVKMRIPIVELVFTLSIALIFAADDLVEREPYAVQIPLEQYERSQLNAGNSTNDNSSFHNFGRQSEFSLHLLQCTIS